MNERELLAVLREVKDPEIPVLDVVELGIVRGVQVGEGDAVRVEITPTYSGCPALRAIEEDIATTLHRHGVAEVDVVTVLQPIWTTDWMTAEARAKLRSFGIAPPGPTAEAPVALGPTVRTVACPYCGASETELRSEFSSTACKALYFCAACGQPFEHFKAI